MSELTTLSTTVTELADKVEAVIQRLDADGSSRQPENRLRAIESKLRELHKRVGQLEHKKAHAEAQQAARKPWSDLTPEEADQRWKELHAWVQELLARNNIGPKEIPDCWYRHNGLVDELEALRWAWLELNNPESKCSEPIRWREALHRARGRWPLFNPNGCATTHSESRARVADDEAQWHSFLDGEPQRCVDQPTPAQAS
jgi:hypothetical protein